MADPKDTDRLVPGEFVKTNPTGPIYKVDHVNESRARLVPITGRLVKNDDDGSEDFGTAGKAINVSPNALVIRIKRVDVVKAAAEDYKRRNGMAGDSSKGAAVGIPIAEKSIREREQERRDTMAKAKTANGKSARPLTGAAAKAASAPKREKAPKTVRECMCGCGGETTGYFVPGHDARFKSWMVQIERGTKEVSSLPKSVQKSTEFKKKGPGFVSLTNYKGEKHSGYDTKSA